MYLKDHNYHAVDVCFKNYLQKLKKTWAWMLTKESHAYCNAFFLVILCRGTDEGNLLDSCEQTFSSIVRITEDVTDIHTLNGKPKLVLIQRYTSK